MPEQEHAAPDQPPEPTLRLALPDGLMERWQTRTVPLGGDHLGWTGSRWLRFGGVTYQGARLAFMLRTGREPVGIVKADCDVRGCVALAHVEDQAGRQRNRMQLRALMGMPAMPAECQQGHDQAQFGRIQRNGFRYCHACQTGHTEAYMSEDAQAELALGLQARYYADEPIRSIAADLGRSYGYVRNLLVSVDTTFRTTSAQRSAA